MQSVLYGIYALNDSCINTVRQHFPWSILYKLDEVSA